MFDKPKIIEGKGIDIYKNNNSSIIKAMNTDFNRLGDYSYDLKAQKIISKNAVPGAQANIAIEEIFKNEEIYKVSIMNSELVCKAMCDKGYIVRDNTAYRPNDFCWTTAFGNNKNELTKVGVGVNSGYTLNMDFVYKFAGSYGVDIKKDVEDLFGMVKSYWNLKMSQDTSDAIETLKSDIENRNRTLDDMRIKIWKQLTLMNGMYADVWEFFNIRPTDPKYRNIIWFKDPWIAFSTGFSLMKNIKGTMDSYITFDLSSLMSDNNRKLLGTQPYPVRIYTMFEVSNRFFGGYKYTRPDGKTY